MLRRLVLIIGLVVVAIGMVAGGFLYWLLAGDGVRLALERQASNWLGVPVHIGVARAQLFPQPGLHLERVDVGDPVRLTLGTVDLSSDGQALLSRRIENASVVVASSRITMPLPFAIPSKASRPGGPAPTAGSAGGTNTTEPIQLVSIRSISLRDIVLNSRGRELTVSAESSLSGSRLVLRSFSARTGGTSLDAQGEVDLRPRVDARLQVKANRLDVDELIALAGAFAPPAGRSGSEAAGPPPRIAARVSAETASAGGFTVRQFATELEADGPRLSLSPLTFQLFGGRYQGALSATLRDTISATLRSKLLDIDVAKLAEFGNSPGTISGTLTGGGTFSGSGPDVATILAAARGDGTASITNGSIRHLDLVRTVILFFGRPAPDAGAASDAFQRLDATFSLANRIVTAQALSLHSDDADVVGSGTLALDSKALSGRADLSLSEALSAQAGRDLARYTREGNRIVLPATIGGTLSAPRISIDAAAAVQRGLRNEIQRRLGDLLDQFKKKSEPPPTPEP